MLRWWSSLLRAVALGTQLSTRMAALRSIAARFDCLRGRAAVDCSKAGDWRVGNTVLLVQAHAVVYDGLTHRGRHQGRAGKAVVLGGWCGWKQGGQDFFEMSVGRRRRSSEGGGIDEGFED